VFGTIRLKIFIISHDQAYLKTIFFSGDRPCDFSEVKVAETLRFPNDDGFLFNHIWGKTLRDDDQNVFGIRRNQRFVPLEVLNITSTLLGECRLTLPVVIYFAQQSLMVEF